MATAAELPIQPHAAPASRAILVWTFLNAMSATTKKPSRFMRLLVDWVYLKVSPSRSPKTDSFTPSNWRFVAGRANQLVVRSFNGYGAGWDEGPILGEANAILPASGTISDCFTSSNGFDFYTEHTFEFSDLGLAAGTDYILHLEEGAAASGCTIAYPDGVAFGTNSSNPSHDLVFEIFHCPDPSLIFGCTDSDACNFNPSATSEDGSCLSLDCALNCGGSAYLDPDCGCVPSEADAGSCYGCMDNSACNYDATSTLQDNSCLYP